MLDAIEENKTGKGVKERQGSGMAVLTRVVKKRPVWGMTFVERPEEGEGDSHVDMWGKSDLSGRNSKEKALGMEWTWPV